MHKIILTIISIVLIMPSYFAQDNLEPEEILVFAASSLTDAFDELANAFMEQTDTTIILNYAGSSTLAVQIENGAPADLFASANPQQMERAIGSNRLDADTVTVFALNELVIAVPADNPAGIDSAADLAQEDLLLVIAAPDVPIREYTDELFLTLAESFGSDFPEAVYANVVSEETNVRQVVARIALAEADAGIVYRTDITPDLQDDITVIELPEGTSPLAQYVIAPLNDSPNRALAERFIQFIASDEGQAILQSWGFCSPALPDDPDTMNTPQPDQTREPEATDEPEEEPAYICSDQTD